MPLENKYNELYAQPVSRLGISLRARNARPYKPNSGIEMFEKPGDSHASARTGSE